VAAISIPAFYFATERSGAVNTVVGLAVNSSLTNGWIWRTVDWVASKRWWDFVRAGRADESRLFDSSRAGDKFRENTDWEKTLSVRKGGGGEGSIRFGLPRRS
jgi:hypothetical protein